MRALVCGAGGFIGGHLVRRLLDEGYKVRAVDIKPCRPGNDDPGWWQLHPEAENIGGASGDLREPAHCHTACEDVDEVYQLAANMGGMGYIETHPLECWFNVQISASMLWAAWIEMVPRYFYASSACIYPAGKQDTPDQPALKEEDAIPAEPEDGYGWEKLFSERPITYDTGGLAMRVARLHNVYGPEGTWKGRRAKAPAAICRKVAEVKLGLAGHVEIWGDGTKTRSFTWIGDCIDGIRRIMKSDVRRPLNLGSSEKVSILQLTRMIMNIAGVEAPITHNLEKPQGVHGRNSDNTLIQEKLGWEPTTTLVEGMGQLYHWVEAQVMKQVGPEG